MAIYRDKKIKFNAEDTIKQNNTNEMIDLMNSHIDDVKIETTKSDGSTAKYYELPEFSKELQDLISYKDMNAQIGEIFRACYRYGEVDHSEKLRDAKKMKFYAEAEINRLEMYEE